MEIDDAVLTITEKDAARMEFPINRVGAQWFRLFFIIAFALLGSRIFFLTVIQGSYYQVLAERNSVRDISLSAPRGLIFDRYGTELVRNVPGMELVIIPAELPKSDQERRALFDRFQSVISFDAELAQNALAEINAGNMNSIVLKQSLTQDESLIFLARMGEFPGIRIKQVALREYIYGLIFSHIIGYEGRIRKEELAEFSGYLPDDSLGKQGIERSYESFLRGKRGANRVEVDSLGVIKNSLGSQNPEPGSDLILNIDAELQKKLFDSLSETLEKSGLKKGAGIALDPRDGSVLALVSIPSFDNNLFAKGITSAEYNSLIHEETLPLFNRVVAGEYPPGSTIKPFLAIAALKEGVVTPNTQIESRGSITVSGFSFGDWKAHGFTDIRHAIAVSSDVYFYSIGGGYGSIRGIGIEKMNMYERQFGFGEETGIDISGEADGFLPTPEWKQEKIGDRWYIGDTYNASIGQGYVLATPLQIVSATAAVANGGTLWKPRIVGQIRHRDGNVQLISPEVKRHQVADPELLSIARDGMRLTVTAGTAQSLNVLPIAVAGKTGTSQFGNEEKTHGWFGSFAPYDAPTIAMVILVENQIPKETYNAVPVTKQVLEWYFTEGRGKDVLAK